MTKETFPPPTPDFALVAEFKAWGGISEENANKLVDDFIDWVTQQSVKHGLFVVQARVETADD